MYSHNAMVCRHLVCHFTHNGISEVPNELIMNSWKIPLNTSHDIKVGPSIDCFSIESNIVSVCTQIMEIGRDSPDNVDSAVAIFNEYVFRCSKINRHHSSNGGPAINLISRFDNPKSRPIRLLVLTLV